MVEYECFPIWEASPNKFGNIDPRSLPISANLANELLLWAAQYEKTLDQEYPPWSGFATQSEADAFERKGYDLLASLKQELGSDYEVISKISAPVQSRPKDQ